MNVVTNFVVAMMIVTSGYKPVIGMKVENGMSTNIVTLYEKIAVTNYQYSASILVNNIEIDCECHCKCHRHFTARPEDLFGCRVAGIFFELEDKHPLCSECKKEHGR